MLDQQQQKQQSEMITCQRLGGGKKEAIFLPPLFSNWLSMQIGENQEEAKGNVSLGHNSSTVRREKQNREV